MVGFINVVSCHHGCLICKWIGKHSLVFDGEEKFEVRQLLFPDDAVLVVDKIREFGGGVWKGL